VIAISPAAKHVERQIDLGGSFFKKRREHQPLLG
jgi:hypothetical protein